MWRYQSNRALTTIKYYKKFDSLIVMKACGFLESNRHRLETSKEEKSKVYTQCLEYLGLLNTKQNRKALSDLYNRKTYTDISCHYNF